MTLRRTGNLHGSRRDSPMPREPMSDQAQRVQELLDHGLSRRQIAEELGVSSPRITQIIGTNPRLRATPARTATTSSASGTPRTTWRSSSAATYASWTRSWRPTRWMECSA